MIVIKDGKSVLATGYIQVLRQIFFRVDGQNFAISNDGNHIVFSGNSENKLPRNRNQRTFVQI